MRIKNKSILLFLVATGCYTTIHAQQLKTDVPVSKQFTTNSVPGLKYAPAMASKAQPSAKKSFEGSSLAHQLKTGTAANLQFAPGTGQTTTTAEQKIAKPNTAAAKLPSEGNVEQTKQAVEAIKKQDTTPAKIPSQESKTEEPVKSNQQ